MIILIDGPEKAGKSTLIAELAKVLDKNLQVRRWGPVSPDDRVYSEPLREDYQSKTWNIWDRGWPSEHVYGMLLGRDRRLAVDPWLGEWLHGRAVQTSGLRVILLPELLAQVDNRRDETDLPVDVFAEKTAYFEYARRFGYLTLINDYTEVGLQYNVNQIISRLSKTQTLTPPAYAGPIDARVVFVGEKLNDKACRSMPGSWLPFSSRLTTELGRRLGDKAFKCGWTNVGDVTQEFLADRYVVACGESAVRWLSGIGIVRMVVPHPAWLYRYNTITYTERDLVDKILNLIGEM